MIDFIRKSYVILLKKEAKTFERMNKRNDLHTKTLQKIHGLQNKGGFPSYFSYEEYKASRKSEFWKLADKKDALCHDIYAEEQKEWF